MKLLAAIAAAAVIAPFTASAQTPPLDGPLDLNAYPAAQRDELWERYARKNHFNVNVLYPVSGFLVSAMVSGVLTSVGLQGVGAISFPVEYERCLNRGMSVYGMVQPEQAFGGGESRSTLTLGAGARAYVMGNAPDGYWVGLHASTVLPVDAVTMRFEVGWNAIYPNHLTASFGMGAGLTYSSTGARLPAVGLRFTAGYVF